MLQGENGVISIQRRAGKNVYPFRSEEKEGWNVVEEIDGAIVGEAKKLSSS